MTPRRSRKDIALGRRLTIGQTWRDRATGDCLRVRQVHRGDCHVELISTAGDHLRAITFEQLRNGWDQVVPADHEVIFA